MTDQERKLMTDLSDIAIRLQNALSLDRIQEVVDHGKKQVAAAEQEIADHQFCLSEMKRLQRAAEERLAELAGATTTDKPKKIKSHKNTLLRMV